MQPNSTIGHYKILRPLGAGGMGEVYLAHDTKLDRDVAVKVLPESLRNDPERLARFRREAKAAASLQHPNIGTIFALEEVDDQLFIVMEYVDGQTLAEAIPEGGMDLDTFFSTFIPLADALAHAHEQGRIHRDIKPGNIMIAKDGTPKILDFGLARIMPVEESSDPEAPTMTMKSDETDPSDMHEGPRLMGTPQYMSPEQAEGRELDHRTDIFSFGVVMYEALTGRKAFEGSSRTSLLGKIVNEQPIPVPELKPITPYLLWNAINRCLRKETKARTQTAYELMNDLRGVQRDVETGTVLVDAATIAVSELEPELIEPVPLRFWRKSTGVAAVAAAMVIGILGTWILKPAPEMPKQPLRKFQWPVETLSWPVISPDGAKVAYTAGNPRSLWIRNLDSTEPIEIPDSDGADFQFWSPGSDQVGYMAQGELRKVPAQGGPGLTLYKAEAGITPRGATWRPDGTIIQDQNAGGIGILVSISTRGGLPSVIMEPDTTRGEVSFHAPRVLPDGKTLVFVMVRKDQTQHLVVQAGDSLRTLVRTNPIEWIGLPCYAPSGHLLYQRSSLNGSNSHIWALPFNANSLHATGEPFIVAEDAGSPSVSGDGTLIYQSSPEGGMQLVWVDRKGLVGGDIGQPQPRISYPALSPDGRRVAAMGDEDGNSDIWIHDADRGTKERLTVHQEWDSEPAWSPTGDRVAFSSDRTIPSSSLFIRAADGSGDTQPIVHVPSSSVHWSRDGNTLAYHTPGSLLNRDLWYVSMTGQRTPVPLLKTPFNEGLPQFSPDGRYVAYQSDRSGDLEVYVIAFPSKKGRWPVSVNGGYQPRWSPKGDELFYIEGTTLMAVSVETQSAFTVGNPRSLFTSDEIKVILATPNPFWPPPYDVSPDGQRFVMVQSVEHDETPLITVVQNWYSEFKDRD